MPTLPLSCNIVLEVDIKAFRQKNLTRGIKIAKVEKQKKIAKVVVT